MLERTPKYIYKCSITYHPTSALFPLSSGVDHTPFQSSINPRTRPYIPHQFHGVPNDNSLLKYELCSLTSSLSPRHHSLFILHFIFCHSTSLLFLQSLQLYLTYLHYYVNRYILKQSVFISQLDCTRASFFSSGPKYVLSESCCSIYLVFFPWSQ